MYKINATKRLAKNLIENAVLYFVNGSKVEAMRAIAEAHKYLNDLETEITKKVI